VGKLLRWAGALIAVTAIVCGIWLQFEHIPQVRNLGTYWRLNIILGMLPPLGIGVLIIGVGCVVERLQSRDPGPPPP
jgi:hypothetical protein